MTQHVDTNGWVMEEDATDLCRVCGYRTQEGDMVCCPFMERAFPHARQCRSYEPLDALIKG